MKGAEAVLRTLVAGGVEVCFTNPGTTEMQYVSALDEVPELRAVLVLFEGVATGAADGYARMVGKPAATLLHLGPGLANGLANLHNAMRAKVPMVNIVGEHATWHVPHDAPLTSNIARYADQVSGWVRVTRGPGGLAVDAAAAVAAARQPPGHIATLITPADCTWQDCDGPAQASPAPPPAKVEERAIAEVAAALRGGEPALFLMSHAALRDSALEAAGRVAARCNARLASPSLFPRIERGAGRVAVDRLPYAVEQAGKYLQGVRHLILVGAREPVTFFGYPNTPSRLTPADARVLTLGAPEQDLADALARLADAVGATQPAKMQARQEIPLPTGPLTPATLAQAVAGLLPEQCVVVDESLTGFAALWQATAGARPHDYLFYTGGAIGDGLPLAVGAAIACPERRVLTLHSDGGAAYNLQALWTQAREQLSVTTVIYANRAYRILEMEYAQAEAGRTPGPKAQRLMRLDRPALDWVQIAHGMGMPARRVQTADEFGAALEAYLEEPGPNLIEAMI
jgi:acetolactate synthase I/II/III large subunit